MAPAHRVVDGGRVDVDAAVVLGHEAQLVGFRLHLHGSLAGYLVIPLGSSNLDRPRQKLQFTEGLFFFLTCSDEGKYKRTFTWTTFG